MTEERCGGCGRAVEGGTEACQARYEALLARDYEDSAFFAVHRMFVDTYSLQHPDRYCRSAKSLAAHLVGLGLILEAGIPAASGAPALRAWLDGRRELEKPELPEARGEITLGDVETISEPGPWRGAVRAWAVSTWQAYSGLHPLARSWAAEAGGQRRPG
ncbi:MAG TPA: DUF5946 family protein [Allosphingosinicella sp.]